MRDQQYYQRLNQIRQKYGYSNQFDHIKNQIQPKIQSKVITQSHNIAKTNHTLGQIVQKQSYNKYQIKTTKSENKVNFAENPSEYSFKNILSKPLESEIPHLEQDVNRKYGKKFRPNTQSNYKAERSYYNHKEQIRTPNKQGKGHRTDVSAFMKRKQIQYQDCDQQKITNSIRQRQILTPRQRQNYSPIKQLENPQTSRRIKKNYDKNINLYEQKSRKNEENENKSSKSPQHKYFRANKSQIKCDEQLKTATFAERSTHTIDCINQIQLKIQSALRERQPNKIL